MRRLSLLLGLCSLTFASMSFAQEGTPPTASERISILFTSDLRGALIDSGCSQSEDREALLPRVSAAVAQERARAANADEPRPLLFDVGDALFPSPMVRDLAIEPRSAEALVSALRSAGYDAMATGNTTFSAPNPAMRGLLAAAAEQGLPMLATNLRCVADKEDEEDDDEIGEDGEDGEDEEESDDPCEQSIASMTDRSALITRGPLKIGVFSVLPEDLGERVSQQNIKGVEFTPPEAATSDIVRNLREAGADLIVLLSHVDRSETAPRRTLELLARLTPEESPDLVLAASTAGLAIRIRTALGGPIVLAVAGDSLGRVVLERVEDEWQVETAAEVETEGLNNEVTSRVLDSWRTLYCERMARTIRGGQLTGEMESDDFLQLALRVMREQTHADIAIINEGIIADRRLFPRQGPLTEGDIRRALPFDNLVRVATIRGSKMSTVSRSILEAEGAVAVGLEKRLKKLRVNGRALDPDARYRIATIDFVAAGGDSILDPERFEFENAEPDERGGTTLAQRITNWLYLRTDEGPFDPEERLDLFTRPLWAGSVLVNAMISSINVNNRSGYDQPLLGRDPTFDVHFGIELDGGMTTRDHRWENRFVLRYGQQRVVTTDEAGEEDSEWIESTDLLQLRSAYNLDIVRNRIFDGAWYGPSFFLEYLLESELSPPDDADENFLEMTGTVGLQLKPLAWLRFSMGAAIRSVVLADDNAPVGGMSFRGELTRRRLFGLPQAPIYITALVDYFLLWPDAGPSHKLSIETRVEVQLYGRLTLTGTLRVFLYDEANQPVATSIESSLGIGVVLNSRTQRY